MLAYVFWHWKKAEIVAEAYEAHQQAFHSALLTAPPVGFIESFSVALPGASWLKGESYEDWYLVQDFNALGLLNEGAVSASRLAPHDAAAAGAAGGTAGLYALQLGSVLNKPMFAYWFSKPAGMSYRELNDQLAPLVEQHHGALWMRQMTLGPALEFCLHSASEVSFPPTFNVERLALRSIWAKPSS